MVEAALVSVSCASSLVTLTIVCLQIKAYGLRTWVRLGAGMGTDIRHAVDEIEVEEEVIEQHKHAH